MRQAWREVLFLHWRVPRPVAQAWLPPGLRADVVDGSAWVSAVAFRAEGSRAGPFPVGRRSFSQVNVRTYATGPHGPGVWFLGCEVGDALHAWLAGMQGLPAVAGAVEVGRGSALASRGGRHFKARWSAAGAVVDEPVARALCQRRRLYALRGGVLCTGVVKHPDWRLFATEGRVSDWGLLPGAVERREPDAVHVSPGLEAEVGWVQPVTTPEGGQAGAPGGPSAPTSGSRPRRR